MSAAFHLDQLLYKPEGLARLIEVTGALRRYACTIRCDLKEFLFSGRILTLICHLLCELGIAMCIVNNCLTAHDNCFQETGFLCVITISYITLIQFLLSFGNDPFITDRQNFFIFNGYVSYTIVEIVSRCKNIVVNGKNRFRCHIRGCKLTGSLAFPVFMYLTELRLGFLRNIKWIGCSGSHCIQLILQPLERILRKRLTSSRRQSAASNDQLLITDDDRNVVQDVGKCLGSAGDDRLVFCCFVRLCDQFCSGRFDYRHLCIKIIYKMCDPVCFRNICYMKFLHDSPFS